jgi:nicotinate dehydrogenase subunit B
MTKTPTRNDLFDRPGTLLITRPGRTAPLLGQQRQPAANLPPDIFIAILDDGRVLGFNGHVDLGTGIRTALAQIVAEELDVEINQVTMVLGDTEHAPDQGPTIASETIQISAVPLRQAAAQARLTLLEAAAHRLNASLPELTVEQGVVSVTTDPTRRISYATLLEGRQIAAQLDETVTVKATTEYRLVGQPVPRVDIPAKALGTFTYVHDLRIPGMLHGRVVRPPYLGHDSGAFVGRSLATVDETSVSDIPGLIAVVSIGDFVGVVAAREEDADRAMRQLRVTWHPFHATIDLADVEQALRTAPATKRVLHETGDVDAALAASAKVLERSYTWPYQMHGSIGPSCAVAHHSAGRLQVWAGTQNPHLLRADLARLMDMTETQIEVVRLEAAGCYGRNCADDVAGDAALLARAVGAPVRVQLTREQEHAWEPKGAAQYCDVKGGLDAEGMPTSYDFNTRYPSNLAPMLPLLLTGKIAPDAAVAQMGDRTAVPPYAYPTMRIAVEDLPPLVRASWMRGVSALPNSFAHECYVDELAAEAGMDPVEYRLRLLKNERAADLVRATAKRAGWVPRTGPRLICEGDIVRGQGFAYAVYVHGPFPGHAAAWAAWVAEVAVNRTTGEVVLEKVTVGQDAGLMINPDGVRHQLHGNVLQTASRTLKEQVTFDTNQVVASREWGAYPILTFREVPEIDVLLMPRPNEPPLGAGESASVPGAAAIANAIFDATGVRFRSAPFTADVILAGLTGSTPPPPPRRKRWWAALAGLGLSAAAGLLGLHAAIPRSSPPEPGTYSDALIERGRVLAEAGDCGVCHTAPGGVAYAGGRAIHTPFGVIHAGNLTPDTATGIGSYSLAAFQRAMREGIGRDGRLLYPAFPYTAYAGLTDADLQALYAYLMAQQAVRAEPKPNRLMFPANLRPLLSVWNLLFHRPDAVFQPDPTRTAQWNRGRYLVDTLGHCGACHTARNAFGAERAAVYLQGAMVDGWEAPALTGHSLAPVPWTEPALHGYLRHGHSAEHGVAAGPMAAVVTGLAALPDSDIAAMAHYLASLSTPPAIDTQALARTLEQQALSDLPADSSPGSRIFQGACLSCHHDGSGPEFLGARVSLAVTTALHAAQPDNLLRVILHGIDEPAHPALGPMPGFADSLSDHQVAELAAFLRRRFAPGRPAWRDLDRRVAASRSGP